MKKPVIIAAVVLALAGAGYLAFSVFSASREKTCMEGEGSDAVDACTFLISWRGESYKRDALARRAQLHKKNKKWDRVISDLNELLAMKTSAPVPPEKTLAAYEALAEAYSEYGSAGDARKYLELATQGGSAQPALYISLAQALLKDKRFSEALALLDTVARFELSGTLEKTLKHPYYNTRASVYEGSADFGKAYGALKTALTVPAPRPVLAATSKHLGLVCFELKRYREAQLYLGYTLKAGLKCPECELLLTAMHGSLDLED